MPPVIAEGFHPAAHPLADRAAHLPRALDRAGLRQRHPRRALARAGEAALVQDEEELVLQVNGKHRGSIR
jgi:hypothetical protein